MIDNNQNSSSQPLVSVIIPTYNSQKTLGQCLASVRNASKDIEAIIVDNFSRDNTVGIANSYGAKVFEYHGERSAGRNFGFSGAKGKFVLFIDSDMELTRGVVKECVTVMNTDCNTGGIVIPERSVGKSFWVKVRDFERTFYTGTEVESARFFRSELVQRVAGYDEDVTFYEESTLPYKIEKIGYSVRTKIAAEIYHHEDDFSLYKWLRKKYYYGKTAPIYRSNYGKYAKSQLSLRSRLGIFFFSRRFYSHPFLATSVLILKFLEFFSAKLGSVVCLCSKKFASIHYLLSLKLEKLRN